MKAPTPLEALIEPFDIGGFHPDYSIYSKGAKTPMQFIYDKAVDNSSTIDSIEANTLYDIGRGVH